MADIPFIPAEVVYDIIRTEMLMYEVATGGPKKAGYAIEQFCRAFHGSFLVSQSRKDLPRPSVMARQFLDFIYGVDGAKLPSWIDPQFLEGMK